ncbi:hypothetical protein [Helicobacter sp. 11S02596-1]|uniref:hypothetical protein n=1 Tax=Helicobacter sp. 11S02596-1 TaxID=1476194 RepID=UPI0015E04705|nr:hypothetical protein [Helicobacter sp. 11S02596-1]
MKTLEIYLQYSSLLEYEMVTLGAKQSFALRSGLQIQFFKTESSRHNEDFIKTTWLR